MGQQDKKSIPLELMAGLFGGGRGNCSLDEVAWQAVMQAQLFDGLDESERASLRELAVRLLADKAFSGAGGLTMENGMATAIAAFAALPVLNLGIEWYGDWREIVVYPGEYVHDGEEVDEHGIVHQVRHERSGEVLEGGPMVLSWQDVEDSGMCDGYNVVIHEFAHKLDMKNGDANGRPPLHSGMDPAEWAREFQAAYDDLCRRAGDGEETEIDPYATESPAEFFAVLSEYFFEMPEVLQREYPGVYALLARFYRQNPLARLKRGQ